ncbi:MAG: 8-oxo-dGTP pyrophosphatase MutT (NUDIX family) [Pirellulaceae bacterium]|jgi:8-oxo-dGTP pyrophosphatase MutT (NUDIX family)
MPRFVMSASGFSSTVSFTVNERKLKRSSMIDSVLQPMKQALREALPGREYQRVASPELSYGRHFGPPPNSASQAAVIILLQHGEDGWTIPLTKRPSTLKHHGGQICLPGGSQEPDESLAECACRELHEELGVQIETRDLIGQLSPIYVFASDFAVTPFVSIRSEALDYRPNPDEVEQLIQLPISALDSPDHAGRHEIERRGLCFRTPHVSWQQHRIWGATHIILSELAEIWRRIRRSGRSSG